MAAQDLTQLATLKSWLPITSTNTNDDATLARLITAVSVDFGRATMRPDLLQASYTEVHQGDGASRLIAFHWPVIAITSLSVAGSAIAASPDKMQNGYYIVSATPKSRAAVYSPLGLVEAQVTQPSVLVHQIDLSYAILHWEAALEEGAALKRRFGERVGFRYYGDEDNGIFWSNDPHMTIGEMIRSLDLVDSSANAERIRKMQDKARGGPPALP